MFRKKNITIVKTIYFAMLSFVLLGCPKKPETDVTAQTDFNEKQKDVLTVASDLAGLRNFHKITCHANIADDLNIEEMLSKDYKINVNTGRRPSRPAKMNDSKEVSVCLILKMESKLGAYHFTLSRNATVKEYNLSNFRGSIADIHDGQHPLFKLIQKYVADKIVMQDDSGFKDTMDDLNKIVAVLYFLQWHNKNVYNKAKLDVKAVTELIEMLKKLNDKFKAPKLCPAVTPTAKDLVVEKDKTELDIKDYKTYMIQIFEEFKKLLELSQNLKDTMKGEKELDTEFQKGIDNAKKQKGQQEESLNNGDPNDPYNGPPPGRGGIPQQRRRPPKYGY